MSSYSPTISFYRHEKFVNLEKKVLWRQQYIDKIEKENTELKTLVDELRYKLDDEVRLLKILIDRVDEKVKKKKK